MGTGAPLSAGMRVNIDYVMSTTGARYGAKIDSTVDRQARPRAAVGMGRVGYCTVGRGWRVLGFGHVFLGGVLPIGWCAR